MLSGQVRGGGQGEGKSEGVCVWGGGELFRSLAFQFNWPSVQRRIFEVKEDTFCFIFILECPDANDLA